ncbi:MAG: hypothetical protein LBB79_09810, partial [Prevotellaceae bacterium]|nr:hypothetical protein [Prevotellaceae bacterium]
YKLKEKAEDICNEQMQKQIAIDILTHKKAKWSGEKEVRVFATGNREDNNRDIPVEIKRIITGRDMDDATFQSIKELVKTYNPNVEVIKEPKQ